MPVNRDAHDPTSHALPQRAGSSPPTIIIQTPILATGTAYSDIKDHPSQLNASVVTVIGRLRSFGFLVGVPLYLLLHIRDHGEVGSLCDDLLQGIKASTAYFVKGIKVSGMF